MKRFFPTYALSIFASLFITTTANAVVVDLQTVPMTISPNSLTFNAGGVTVTAGGYHVEYDSSAGATTIYGPFTTATVNSTPSFLYPGFGRIEQIGFPGQPNTVISGLALQANEDLGQTDRDATTGAFQVGLDNRLGTGSLPSIQFALFSFSAPVNISQVIVDDNSNFGRAIWAAGGSAAPDLTQDFLSAFAGYSFRNSPDDAADGFFTHSFTPLQGISYLAVGTPPDPVLIGDLGPLVSYPTNATHGFFIEGLNLTQVPVPAAVWLFGSGLLGLIGIARRKNTA